MIHIVPTFHHDVIYLENSRSYLKEVVRILDAALALLEREPAYRFSVEQVFALEHYWKVRPENREKLRRVAAEGRLECAPGMYVMPDMNMMDGESFFRQVEIGFSWLEQHLGVRPVSCWMPDSWGHPQQLPQMLKLAGYRTYFFWRCMRREERKRLFRWRGLDGTEIPTVWLSHGYGGVHCSAGSVPDAVREVAELAQEMRAFGAGDVLLPSGGDVHGPEPDSAEAFHEVAGSISERMRFSTPAEFADGIDFAARPKISGEFNGLFQGSYAANIFVKQKTRSLVQQLLTLERFQAVSGLAGTLLPAWKRVLKCQFHDTICGTVCDAGLAETERDLAAAEKMIAGKMPAAGNFFFNPLGRSRTFFSELRDGTPVHGTLPPLGSGKGKIDSKATWKSVPPENFPGRFYRVSITPDGWIGSLIPAGTETDLVQKERVPFGAPVMQLDNGDNWVTLMPTAPWGDNRLSLAAPRADALTHEEDGMRRKRTCFLPEIESVRASESAHSLTVEQMGKIQFWKLKVTFTLQTVFRTDSPLIECRLKVLPQGKRMRLRLVWPLSLTHAVNTHGIAFGHQRRPDTELPMMDWFDERTPRAGLSLIAPGIYAASHDSDGHMLLTIFRSTAMEYKCDSARSYQSGVPQSFHYALYPHNDNRNFSPVSAHAEEFTFPPIACEREIGGLWHGELPPNIRLSSFRRGKDVFQMRLAEVSGKKTRIRLNAQTFPFRPFEIREIVWNVKDTREFYLESSKFFS